MAQLKTVTEEGTGNCFRKCQQGEISVFKARSGILRASRGNVSFSVIIFPSCFMNSKYLLLRIESTLRSG